MVARNVAYHFRQQQRGFVSWWHVLQKECREYAGPADLVALLLDPFSESGGTSAKHLGDRTMLVRQSGDWPTHERAETGRPESDADGKSTPGQMPVVAMANQASHVGLSIRHRQVDRGVRQNRRGVGLPCRQVPRDSPQVLDQIRQTRRRWLAPMVEMPRRHARQQDRRFTHLLPHTCRLGAQQQEIFVAFLQEAALQRKND